MEGAFSKRVRKLKRESEEKYLFFVDYVMNPKHRSKYIVSATPDTINIRLKTDYE